MGLNRYRGTVNTIETAALDHRVLTIRCTRCDHSRNIWARKIQDRYPDIGSHTPLRQNTKGFRCMTCNNDEAHITAKTRR